MADFTGKRIVITGAAGVIGLETARQFMEQGGHVIVADVDDAKLAAAEERLGRVRAAYFQTALDTPAACAATLDAAAGPVFAVVHLDGLAEVRIPEDGWLIPITDGLAKAHRLAMAFRTRFDRREPSRLVLGCALTAYADPAAHAAARGAVTGLTQALALKLAPDVLVNAVVPGFIQTADAPPPGSGPVVPLGRAGSPAEVAGVIRFLCSREASYVSGQVIAVDGGLAAR